MRSKKPTFDRVAGAIWDGCGMAFLVAVGLVLWLLLLGITELCLTECAHCHLGGRAWDVLNLLLTMPVLALLIRLVRQNAKRNAEEERRKEARIAEQARKDLRRRDLVAKGHLLDPHALDQQMVVCANGHGNLPLERFNYRAGTGMTATLNTSGTSGTM